MNTNDLNNFTTYLISLETKGIEYCLEDFEFLNYQEFENVSPKNTLELAWMISNLIEDEDQDIFSNMTDSIIYIFSIIKWFHKNAWDIDEYIDGCISYLGKQAFSKTINGRYLITRIIHETVVIDIQEREWYGESHEDLPEEINQVFKR